MDRPVQKHIVVSAVNIRKGGTLTVLRDCLGYLSHQNHFSVTALVHDQALVGVPGIHYIEIPWSTKSWLHRIWCEYITMHRISKMLQPVHLWFSLHDTTPRVQAERQAVYCHTSFPFLKLRWKDWLTDYKIPPFRLFTRFAYRINVHHNQYLVVQQQWMRDSLSGLIHFPASRIIVAPPSFNCPEMLNAGTSSIDPVFFYPSTADCHKNFETLCKAVEILEKQEYKLPFRLVLTIDGTENRYAASIRRRYGHLSSIEFHGYMSKDKLYMHYAMASCLVFPSRIETWGLPISEFKPSGKPMILSDMPYAHETAAGADSVIFFNPDDAPELAACMRLFLQKNFQSFQSVPLTAVRGLFAQNWDALFDKLLD